MYKRGLSEVVSTVLIVLLVLVAMTFVWIFIYTQITKEGESAQARQKLSLQRFNIKNADINGGQLSILIDSASIQEILINATPINKSTDIVFLLDSTKSMEQEINETRNTINSFASQLQNEGIDYRLALVEFKDYPNSPCGTSTDFQNKTHLFNNNIFTTNTNEFTNQINSISIENGGDIPESHLTALNSILDFPYRQEADKIAILLTDAPPHASDCEYPKSKMDITLINDISGSMNAASWNIETTIDPAYQFDNISVETVGYSEILSFSIPQNTERATVVIDWEPNEYLNSRVQFNISDPNDVSLRRISSSTLQNGENYTGPSSKPQSLLINSPTQGEWNLTIYRVFHPSLSTPEYYNFTVKVYLGSPDQIYQTPYIHPGEESKKAAIEFVNQIDIEDNRIALVKYNASASLAQDFSQDKSILNNTIQNYEFSGETGIANALNFSLNHSINRARSDAQKIFVLLTDGLENQGGNVSEISQIAKDNKVTLITIGLGANVDNELLRNIAFDPSYFYQATDPAKITEIYQTLAQRLNNEGVQSNDYETTNYSCYQGPESVRGVIDKFKNEKIQFYLINKEVGECKDRIMEKNFTEETEGKYYNYNEGSGQVSNIINNLASTIVNNFAGKTATNYLLVIVYSETETQSFEIKDLPKISFETKEYTLPITLTNIKKIEIYPVVITPSGEEIIASAPSDTYEFN